MPGLPGSAADPAPSLASLLARDGSLEASVQAALASLPSLDPEPRTAPSMADAVAMVHARDDARKKVSSGPALSKAKRAARTSSLPRRSVRLVSRFQRGSGAEEGPATPVGEAPAPGCLLESLSDGDVARLIRGMAMYPTLALPGPEVEEGVLGSLEAEPPAGLEGAEDGAAGAEATDSAATAPDPGATARRTAIEWLRRQAPGVAEGSGALASVPWPFGGPADAPGAGAPQAAESSGEAGKPAADPATPPASSLLPSGATRHPYTRLLLQAPTPAHAAAAEVLLAAAPQDELLAELLALQDATPDAKAQQDREAAGGKEEETGPLLGPNEMYDVLAQRSGEEEAYCAVCGDGHSESPNEIVFCERCDVAVHQRCYDTYLTQEGVVAGLEGVRLDRASCAICGQASGSVVTCNASGCAYAFHPLCARNLGLYLGAGL
ncbi:Protein lin-49 [Auxenochlorella protothecoides]|uniref:Protein lin-49 n=1 Tax=Auxenochlorella protothecoides TaxID=3075 RepID=A0A087SR85_AUXPR|nr:Protein lin-49 [Auxenochlorella protothecoides]KFM28239.1 Protein lin-49 [Auxenochlorella protothecoides]